MATTGPRLTALKIGYKGEIHRLRVDLSVFSLSALETLFAQTFQLAPKSFVVQYRDADGDCVNVCNETEYAEACHVFLSVSTDEVKSLRFEAVSRAQVAFQENVADPILKAIEKLVETLNVAMDKVKHEHWAQRAQTGLDQTNEALSRAAKEARASLSVARHSISEIPFDQMLKDTTEGLNRAAEGISVFAQEMVEELKHLKYPANASTTVTTEDVQTSTDAVETAEVATTSSDSEWEEVAQQAVVVPVVAVEEAPVVVVAPTEEELKWAAEVAMVRDIFPNVETSRIIESLEQCNGNVQVVLNALMEAM